MLLVGHGMKTVIVIALALVACSKGKTTSAIFKENEARMAELRRDLGKVAAIATPPASKPCVKGAVPVEQIDVMSVEQLTNRDAKPPTDLMMSILNTCFAWFNGPAAASLREDDDEANRFGTRVAKCAARTHVLVARPLAADATSATMRYDLVRIADQAVVCGFQAKAATAVAASENYDYKLVERDSGKVVGGGYHDGQSSGLWSANREALVAAAQRELGVTLPLKDDF